MEHKQEAYVISVLINQTHNTITYLGNVNADKILLKSMDTVFQKVQTLATMIRTNVLLEHFSILITECVLLAPMDVYHVRTVIHVKSVPQDLSTTLLQAIVLSYVGMD